MIFQHTHELVLSGAKTQTRRIVKPRTIPLPEDASPRGETDGDWLYDCYGTAPLTVFSAKPCKPGTGFWGLGYTPARPKYRVGSQYSVQPGCGQKAVGRIEVTGIRREDVRNISYEDAMEEGYSSPFVFLRIWAFMHDKPANTAWFNHSFADGDESGMISDAQGWMSWLKGTRPAERYQAWVLEFRLVEPAP